MINTDGNNWDWSSSDDTTWENISYMTVSCKHYHELVEKARKWDNFIKMVNGEEEKMNTREELIKYVDVRTNINKNTLDEMTMEQLEDIKKAVDVAKCPE